MYLIQTSHNDAALDYKEKSALKPAASGFQSTTRAGAQVVGWLVEVQVEQGGGWRDSGGGRHLDGEGGRSGAAEVASELALLGDLL